MADETDWRESLRRLEGPIVVFGASGFIGANLVRTILEMRDDCFAVTHQEYVPWRLAGLPTERILRCDIRRRDETLKLFDRFRFKTIFDLATYGGYARQSDVPQIYETNVLGLVNVIDGASRAGFSALVHAGSSSEYGLNSAGSKEDARLVPNSHYSVSKIGAHYLIEYLARERGLPMINLRYYSVYGPWEESDRLVYRLVAASLQGKLPPLVDPEISRDFVYVDDAIEAAILAADHGVRRAPGAALNVASGKKTTIREIAELVRAELGVAEEPKWATMPNRAWDLKDWYGDPERAAEVLGFRAHTSLRDGLLATREWMREAKGRPEIAQMVKIAAPPRVSVVVACYRDGQAIPVMHERLTRVFRELKVDYEIIFVNDASPDDSDQVLAGLIDVDEHVVAIEHSRNFGSQNAFLSGMQIATGDAIVLMDGDLQDPPEVISEFYGKWTEGYEVVYGRRVKRIASRVMNFFYRTFYRVFRKLAYVSVPVDAGDFSMMDRKVVNELLAMKETDLFLRGLRAWVGFKQTGVDYVRPERMFGVTTNSWRKNLWWARKAIVNFSFVPLELMLYAGLGLTGLSFLLALAQIIAKLVWPNVPHGITTLIVLVLFFGGVQMLATSILGEYVGNIFEESKRRPKFIRKAIRYGKAHLTDAREIERFLGSRRGEP